MADSHRIYLMPKRSKMDNWANGSFRMTVQDFKDVIKDFDDEWKKALEDATALPTGTTQTDPVDKGKDKEGPQMKDTAEGPPSAQKRKDAEEEPIEAPKRKKSKASKPALETALTDDDYEQIAARLKEEMKDSFEAMQLSQDKL